MAHGIYYAHTGPLTWMARAHALALRLGPGGALTTETAAHLHGIEARAPQVLNGALVSRQVRRLAGTRVTRRRALDIVTRQGLPVTSAASTVLDLVAQLPQSQWRDAVHLMARWVHSGKVSADEVLEALAERGRYPRRSLVTTALEPIAAGIESILELDSLEGVILRHGLPRPTLQARGQGPHGEIRRDAEWEPYGVVLESDGRLFHSGASLQTDRRRDRYAARTGRVTLRAGHAEIRFGRCDLAIDIFLALRSRGYQGDILACSPRCPARTLCPALNCT